MHTRARKHPDTQTPKLTGQALQGERTIEREREKERDGERKRKK